MDYSLHMGHVTQHFWGVTAYKGKYICEADCFTKMGPKLKKSK